MLQDYLLWRAKQQLKRGWPEMPPWLFFNGAGQCLDERRVRRHFARALKGADLSAFRVYDLRHTLATQLLSQGVPLTYVSAQLGHARPTTTLQWYSHWLPSADSHRVVDGLDSASARVWHQFGAKGSLSDARGKGQKEKAPDFSGAFKWAA